MSLALLPLLVITVQVYPALVHLYIGLVLKSPIHIVLYILSSSPIHATHLQSSFSTIQAIEKKLNDGKKGDTKKVPKLKRSRSTVSLIKAAGGKGSTIKETVQLSSIKVAGEQLQPINEVQATQKKAGEESDARIKDLLSKDVSFCDSLPSSQNTLAGSSQESKTSVMDDSALYITASEGRWVRNNLSSLSVLTILLENM